MRRHLTRVSRVGLILVVVTLLLAGTAQAVGTPTIDWWTFAGGGGSETGGIYTLKGVTGQPYAAQSSGGGANPCEGFFCTVGQWFQTYLPLVLK